MYKTSIPFLLGQIDKYGVEPFIKRLKEVNADIVFLALECYKMQKEEQEKVFDSLRKNVPIFQAAGFTVGVWVWAFMIKEKNNYTHITTASGNVSYVEVCPSDKDFCNFAYEYMQNIAKSNPDIIMFDDDFRYGFLDGSGLGCTCKNHRAYMSKILGEDLSTKELAPLIFSGGKNKYRSAFLQANGHYLREFAKQSRAAVDSINPNIRLGACSCMSTWDFDGISSVEIARILAGKTKPFMRLIGAPYWAYNRSWRNRLQDVIELERMESSWCDDDIELWAEGDVYPRPRFTSAANVLEGFDMALRASGSVNGIHKYTFDYYAAPGYEEGYNNKHLKNQPIYNKIDKYFADKTPVGVRVYEHITKFENMDVPAYYDGKDSVQNLFFSPASWMMSAQTIPTIYNGLGTVGIAFGENSKYLDKDALDNGLILDISAAKILQGKGIDVGLERVESNIFSVDEEYFPSKNLYVGLMRCPAYEIKVKNDAKILSLFITETNKNGFVGSYSYENKDGQKFLVFAFDGYNYNDHAFKQPARGKQIVEWINSIGKCLPAVMLGNPDCYMLCKENEKEKAVWIGNFFADECMNTTVCLDKNYSEIEFVNCIGKLNGCQVELEYVAPYASVGFVVR